MGWLGGVDLTDITDIMPQSYPKLIILPPLIRKSSQLVVNPAK